MDFSLWILNRPSTIHWWSWLDRNFSNNRLGGIACVVGSVGTYEVPLMSGVDWVNSNLPVRGNYSWKSFRCSCLKSTLYFSLGLNNNWWLCNFTLALNSFHFLCNTLKYCIVFVGPIKHDGLSRLINLYISLEKIIVDNQRHTAHRLQVCIHTRQ